MSKITLIALKKYKILLALVARAKSNKQSLKYFTGNNQNICQGDMGKITDYQDDLYDYDYWMTEITRMSEMNLMCGMI